MHTVLVLTFVLAAAASRTLDAKKATMLADADARPKVALAVTAKPMRLEEPPPTAVEMMRLDREKAALQPQTDKPAPFPAEPRPPK